MIAKFFLFQHTYIQAPWFCLKPVGILKMLNLSMRGVETLTPSTQTEVAKLDQRIFLSEYSA